MIQRIDIFPGSELVTVKIICESQDVGMLAQGLIDYSFWEYLRKKSQERSKEQERIIKRVQELEPV